MVQTEMSHPLFLTKHLLEEAIYGLRKRETSNYNNELKLATRAGKSCLGNRKHIYDSAHITGVYY